MTSEGYWKHILPVVVGWITRESEDTYVQYQFINDTASVHKAAPAREYLSAHGIKPTL